MSIEAGIYSKLANASVAGGRVYPGVAPNGVTSPYVNYMLVGPSFFKRTFDKATKDVVWCFQFDCWCEDAKTGSRLGANAYAQVLTVADALVDALVPGNYDGENVVDVNVVDLRDLPESEYARRMVRVEFTVKRND
jgi:hypothetical protein